MFCSLSLTTPQIPLKNSFSYFHAHLCATGCWLRGTRPDTYSEVLFKSSNDKHRTTGRKELAADLFPWQHWPIEPCCWMKSSVDILKKTRPGNACRLYSQHTCKWCQIARGSPWLRQCDIIADKSRMAASLTLNTNVRQISFRRKEYRLFMTYKWSSKKWRHLLVESNGIWLFYCF